MPIPRYLYRVFDESSVSSFDEDTGFVAGLPNGAFDRNKYWAKHVVQRHMDWGNRSRTPFISTTSLQKAEHYAEQRLEEWGHDGVYIAKIDTATLRAAGVEIFHMATLVREVRAYIVPPAWNQREYLCLHRIPPEAVIDCWMVEFTCGWWIYTLLLNTSLRLKTWQGIVRASSGPLSRHSFEAQ